MAGPSIHVTKNGVQKKFWGGRPGRTCASKIDFPAKPCETCQSLFKPQRRWARYCNVRCRDKRKVRVAMSKQEKIVRKSTPAAPFGTALCPICRTEFKLTRFSKKYCSFRCSRRRIQGNWANKNRKLGLCLSCVEKPITGSVSFCEKHWLAQAAWRAGLRGKEKWRIVKQILERQDYTCPYTGRKLVIGENASIDHKNPRAAFVDQVGLESNLEWVDGDVNWAKHSMTREEFIAFCRLVVERNAEET